MELDGLIRRWETAKAARGNWNSIFQEIADRVLPQASSFNQQTSDGSKRTDLMYDATAALGLQRYAAALESFASPRNQRWHGLTVSDAQLKKSHRVKKYLEDVTDALFRVRYSPRAAFAAQLHEMYLSFGAFGTAGLFVDDDIKARTIRYKSLNLANTYMLENQHGLIDTVFRSSSMTLRQIEQRWPGKLPDKLRQRLEKYPDERSEVVHFVGPRVDYEPTKIGRMAMPWASCYFMPGEKHELDEGGFWSWPFGIARCMTVPDEIYGRSPSWLALADIKVLNEQKKTQIKAAHKSVDPPLLVHEDGVLQAFSMTPGYLNFGGLNSAGAEMVKPLVSPTKYDIGIDVMDREREIIGQAYLADVFRALVENPQMTATQAMELISERAVLVAPVLGRINSEGLGNVIAREIDILARADQLPEVPDELIGGEYEIEYTSPMSKAMRAGDGVAILRTLEAVTPLAQVDPGVLDPFDLKKAARELAEINGVPASIMRSEEDVDAMEEGRMQAAEAKQLLEAAPSVTSAAANLVKLQQNAGVPL